MINYYFAAISTALHQEDIILYTLLNHLHIPIKSTRNAINTLGGLYRQISQALAVLVPVSTVGVMGDERSYENVVALRAVETTDFMTADFSHIPFEVLGRISSRIINEVRGVNRVVYDISSKPPATIEWE